MSSDANQYIREVLADSDEAPPPIAIRYFYTSLLAIDDPLSPLPPPSTSTSTAKQPPARPFSAYDNQAIENAWLDLRKKMCKQNEKTGEQERSGCTPIDQAIAQLKRKRQGSASSDHGWTQGKDVPGARSSSAGKWMPAAELVEGHKVTISSSLKALDPSRSSPSEPNTTGTPFVRAPSRQNSAKASRAMAAAEGGNRPDMIEQDSYQWDADMERALPVQKHKGSAKTTAKPEANPCTKVPVGVSRLHHVVMEKESIRLEPIYWSPLSDIAQIVRGTWFYRESMMPVEVEVANMLEVGYLELKPWTQTWKDELNSAAEVGAFGEMKIVHKLWPDRHKKADSRPASSQRMQAMSQVQNTLLEREDPARERRKTVQDACDVIDVSTRLRHQDHKAAGDVEYGLEGRKHLYVKGGIMYASENEAYILKPTLQPSDYYGRRPLANYIRKGRPIGVCVVRGFDQAAWDRLHPSKNAAKAQAARAGVSSAQAGAPAEQRQKLDAELAQSERPKVTDLVLVIHGIGQKLSERKETFHFTHAMNAFRREMNVELGTSDVKRQLRESMGGIMVLPINWRHRVSLEVNDGEAGVEDATANQYTLKDITPDTLSSVRGIVSDVMLDIPYYLSPTHNPKMVSACIQEANRVYRLWCANNTGFGEYGRVHLIAHSLGSVMAVDILSQQPTYVERGYDDGRLPESQLPDDQFIFDTVNLFVCGSPAGLFLLMKNASLLPRRGRDKAGAEDGAGVGGEQGTYGCLAVDNLYNIINPYDPVACRVNPAVDVVYASMLKLATIPSAAPSYFSSLHLFQREADGDGQPASATRLPCSVELETHDFSREEIAERRAYLLNDNGQIDYYLKYGGGPLQIEYLTMLGAHSSYWLSRDFVRMIAVEIGREVGREGTVASMRAQKKKQQQKVVGVES